MGLTYLGPVDGHNMRQMMKLFNEAKRVEGPVVVHVLTKKGRGYEPASAIRTGFMEQVLLILKQAGYFRRKQCRVIQMFFSKALVSLGEKNKKLTAITAAMPDGTGLVEFPGDFRQIFDVGIAEEHAVSFAAGSGSWAAWFLLLPSIHLFCSVL
mgnify:CR=1 FL=1